MEVQSIWRQWSWIMWTLSWRMVSEFLHLWTDCLQDLPTASGGRTMVGYYGTTFVPGIYQPAGFVGMPSVYVK